MSMIPQFETERLILRGVQPKDYPSYQKNFHDYEIIRHLSAHVPWPFPDNGVQTYVESLRHKLGQSHWQWGLFLKNNPDEMIGAIDLWREGNPEHRGFWLARAHHGKGLMTEAVYPVNDYAFDHLGFELLILSNAVGNTRSRRIKEKTGAVFLRTEPFDFVDKAYKEHEVWELTKSAWQQAKLTPHP